MSTQDQDKNLHGHVTSEPTERIWGHSACILFQDCYIRKWMDHKLKEAILNFTSINIQLYWDWRPQAYSFLWICIFKHLRPLKHVLPKANHLKPLKSCQIIFPQNLVVFLDVNHLVSAANLRSVLLDPTAPKRYKCHK